MSARAALVSMAMLAGLVVHGAGPVRAGAPAARTTRCNQDSGGPGRTSHPTSVAPATTPRPGPERSTGKSPAQIGFTDFNGDGYPDVAVAAFCEDVQHQTQTLVDAGLVQVMYGSPAGIQAASPDDQVWTEDAVGIPGQPSQALAQFGWALAVGDLNGDGRADLAIGIPFQDITVEGTTYAAAGAVEVLYGSTGGLTAGGAQFWSQATPGLITQPPQPDGGFGRSLTVADYNGDGYADLGVGGRKEDVGSVSQAGNVNVLYGSAAGLTTDGNQLWNEGSLPGVADGVEAGDWFGRFVASGNFNGDAYADLVVAIPFEDLEGSNRVVDAGALAVIYGSSSGLQAASPPAQFWTQDSPGVLGVAEKQDLFGRYVAAGDFNGDSFGDLAVGVRREDVGTAKDAGAVNVLYGSQDGLQAGLPANQMWIQGTGGVPDTPETGDQFGRSLAVGDFNADSYADLAVGVTFEDLETTGAVDAGAVTVIYGSAAGLQTVLPAPQFWTQDSPWVKDVAETGDAFGGMETVADWNGDGYPDLCVSVRYEDVSVPGGGTVVDAGEVQVLYSGPNGVQADSPDDQIWRQGVHGLKDKPERLDLFGWGLSASAGG